MLAVLERVRAFCLFSEDLQSKAPFSDFCKVELTNMSLRLLTSIDWEAPTIVYS